jgi:hypothetical protein
MIERKIIKIPHKKVIKPAEYQEKDTGTFKEVTIVKDNGDTEKKLVPIFEKIFIDAVIEETFIEKDVFCVTIEKETHEFATEKEAMEFLK